MAKKWKIDWYISQSQKSPVQVFFDSLSKRARVKMLRAITYLEEYGIFFSSKAVKKLKGYPLWELRVVGKDNIRVLFFHKKEKHIILLHGFVKKSEKTPKKEIQTAMKRLHRLTSHI